MRQLALGQPAGGSVEARLAWVVQALRTVETASKQDVNMPIKVISKAGAPAVIDLADGTAAVFKDTVGGDVVLAYNDGGVLLTVALA